jgi:Cu+-exporting ATPase
VLRLAAAVEAASEHPIARAVVAGAASPRAGAAGAAIPRAGTAGAAIPRAGTAGAAIPPSGAPGAGPVPPVRDFANVPGVGVRGTVAGRSVTVGRARPDLPADLVHARDAAEAAGRTVVAVACGERVRGLLVVADVVKPTSRAAVDGLRALGLTPILLTGDNETVARAVAAEVGIERVISGVLPADKVDVVKGLQDEGRVVAMIGDGVNDAAALAQADLGLAMGTGTDVAIEASDLTLVRGDLRAAVDAIRLSRRTLRTIKGNLFWAFAYNVAALPLAAAGLLNPMLAGATMALSSVFVVSNSLRLRTFRSTARETGGQPARGPVGAATMW